MAVTLLRGRGLPATRGRRKYVEVRGRGRQLTLLAAAGDSLPFGQVRAACGVLGGALRTSSHGEKLQKARGRPAGLQVPAAAQRALLAIATITRC